MPSYSIGAVVERTGVSEATLRMWERRHGFPLPVRLASGHRRYSELDVEAVKQIAAQRAAGTPLTLAVERARHPSEAAPSLFATLRRRYPALQTRVLSKPVLLSLSRAIEDEGVSRAERPLLFASFQRERYYRAQERRWRELAGSAAAAFVFADFARLGRPAGGPTEIPVPVEDPLIREWILVFDAPGYAVCLSAWEAPRGDGESAQRRLESMWSVEPAVVREAARTCAAAIRSSCELPGEIQDRLDAPAGQATDAQLELSCAIANRALASL